MNNVILRKVIATESWQPLTHTPLVGTFTLSSSPENASNVLFRTVSEPAHELAWVPGEWHTMHRVDLSTIQIKAADPSSESDIVTVVGGTW